eukprot:COSAG01_NODE_3095_length_6592_cov_88.338980_2_plen_78_part_00
MRRPTGALFCARPRAPLRAMPKAKEWCDAERKALAALLLIDKTARTFVVYIHAMHRDSHCLIVLVVLHICESERGRE